MSSIWLLEHEDGAGWAVASALMSNEQGSAPAYVLVPIDRIPELSATELGLAVRSLCALAQRCHAEELARQILHLARTPTCQCPPSGALAAALVEARLWLHDAAPESPLARSALRIIAQLMPATQKDDMNITIARLLHAHTASDALFVAVGQRDGFVCSRCGAPTDLHVVPADAINEHDDHVLPRLLCVRCITRPTRR